MSKAQRTQLTNKSRAPWQTTGRQAGRCYTAGPPKFPCKQTEPLYTRVVMEQRDLVLDEPHTPVVDRKLVCGKLFSAATDSVILKRVPSHVAKDLSIVRFLCSLLGPQDFRRRPGDLPIDGDSLGLSLSPWALSSN